MKNLYYRYKIDGLNLDRLLNLLAKKGIKVYKVQKKGIKTMFLSIPANENENFFAYLNYLCYNRHESVLQSNPPRNAKKALPRQRRNRAIDTNRENALASKHFYFGNNKPKSVEQGKTQTKQTFANYTVTKVGEYGVMRPIAYLTKRIGLLVGAIIFVASSYLTAPVVLAVDYVGTGAQHYLVAQTVLEENGVKPFSYCDLSVSKLADRILERTDLFSFVSVKKVGARIKVNLVKAQTGCEIASKTAENLCSTVNGVIERIKVYRGTAEVSVGDSVTQGQLLVGGYNIVGDQTLKTFVVSEVWIITQKTFEFVLENDSEPLAKLFAIEQMNGETVTQTLVEQTKQGDKTKYTVTVSYRIIIGV